jgi:chromosome segregation ATPase
VEELREAIAATRSQLKAANRTLRATLQLVSDLEERLDRLDAQPEEAQRDQHLNGELRHRPRPHHNAGAAV